MYQKAANSYQGLGHVQKWRDIENRKRKEHTQNLSAIAARMKTSYLRKHLQCALHFMPGEANKPEETLVRLCSSL